MLAVFCHGTCLSRPTKHIAIYIHLFMRHAPKGLPPDFNCRNSERLGEGGGASLFTRKTQSQKRPSPRNLATGFLSQGRQRQEQGSQKCPNGEGLSPILVVELVYMVVLRNMQRGRTSFAQEDELPDPDSGVYCQLRGVGAYPGERDTVRSRVRVFSFFSGRA